MTFCSVLTQAIETVVILFSHLDEVKFPAIFDDHKVPPKDIHNHSSMLVLVKHPVFEKGLEGRKEV
jgi:hypothetical protein